MGVVYRNIEAERIKTGLKREEMAIVAGVTLRTYNNWIRHKTEMPSSKVKNLAEFFNVSTDYLLEQYNAKGN